jgi:phosphate transport system substrate-binding protein
MKKMKVLLVFTLVASMLLGMGVAANAANGGKIVLDGKTVESVPEPQFENNSALVPIRIAESLGGEVGYNNASKKVTVTTADHKIELALNSKTAVVDGKNVTMDVPLKGIGGYNYVPISFISETLGADVSYVASSKTVNITYFANMSGSLKLGGSTTIYPPATAAADALMKVNKGLSVTVAEGGSGAGIKGASTGEFHIGTASKDLGSSDLATYPDLKQTQIGSDAVAIIVHKDNALKNLTKQQVFDIFTGKTTNWKDLGGNDAPIFVQTRESTSGTLDCLLNTALKPIKSDATVISTATPHNSTGLLLQAVKDNENAVGFVSLGYVDDTVKAVSIDDIQCTFNNAFSGIWPYTRHLNLITKGTASGLSAKFINYMRSPEGQKILTDNNYLPLFDKYLK